VIPSSSTGLELLTSKNARTFDFLPTSLPSLDKFLYGGIPSGSITEVVGPAGVGKTQFCHLLSILATLPKDQDGLDGGVIYFDTETTFSVDRIIEMAREKKVEWFSDLSKLEDLASRITVYKLNTSSDIVQRLNSLEEIIIEKNVKLIILDSVASVARKEFDGNSMARRQETLSKEASILKYLAETFNIPVIVTNQVTTRFEFQGNDRDNNNRHRSYVTPALGTLWAHCVNTRLVFEYFGEGRRITIAKSPISPVVSFPYVIAGGGPELITQDGKEIVIQNPENYWEMKIISRSNIAPGMNVNSQHHVGVIKQATSKFHYPSRIGQAQHPLFNFNAMEQ